MKVPFSEEPSKPKSTNWWLSMPGILAALVILGGLLMVVCGLNGDIGPHARY